MNVTLSPWRLATRRTMYLKYTVWSAMSMSGP